MNSGRIFMSAVMLAIFVVMVGLATQYPPQARFMPLVIGIPGFVLCLFQLAIEIRARRRHLPGEVADGRSEFEKAQDEVARIVGHPVDFEVAHETLQVAQLDPSQGGENRREFLLWGSFIGLVAGLILFGFWATIPVFLALFLHGYGKESWRLTLMVSAAATALLYVIFAKGLGVTLHGGFITEYLLGRF
jgi:Tripartite tricarboxylate transporter TctB family